MGTFVPGTVLRALTKMTMTSQMGDRTLPILETREVRPREDTCSRPHTQEWLAWDSGPALGDSIRPLPARGIWDQAPPTTPGKAPTHILPSSCIAKNAILKHKVSL